MSDVEVRHNPEQRRYEAWLDDELAGVAEYRLTGETITFTHTVVEDRFEGRGVGSALAQGALDDVRSSGERTVVPMCPFIKGWIGKHPDYEDLLAAR